MSLRSAALCIFFDFETTGLHLPFAELLEIASVARLLDVDGTWHNLDHCHQQHSSHSHQGNNIVDNSQYHHQHNKHQHNHNTQHQQHCHKHIHSQHVLRANAGWSSEFRCLLRPSKGVPKKVQRMTGITRQLVERNGLDFFEAMQRWMHSLCAAQRTAAALVEGPLELWLIGHNVLTFDLPLLFAQDMKQRQKVAGRRDRFGTIAWEVPRLFEGLVNLSGVVDSLRLARQLACLGGPLKGLTSFSLSNLHLELTGEVLQNAHSALGDAKGVARVCQSIVFTEALLSSLRGEKGHWSGGSLSTTTTTTTRPPPTSSLPQSSSFKGSGPVASIDIDDVDAVSVDVDVHGVDDIAKENNNKLGGGTTAATAAAAGNSPSAAAAAPGKNELELGSGSGSGGGGLVVVVAVTAALQMAERRAMGRAMLPEHKDLLAVPAKPKLKLKAPAARKRKTPKEAAAAAACRSSSRPPEPPRAKRRRKSSSSILLVGGMRRLTRVFPRRAQQQQQQQQQQQRRRSVAGGRRSQLPNQSQSQKQHQNQSDIRARAEERPRGRVRLYPGVGERPELAASRAAPASVSAPAQAATATAAVAAAAAAASTDAGAVADPPSRMLLSMLGSKTRGRWRRSCSAWGVAPLKPSSRRSRKFSLPKHVSEPHELGLAARGGHDYNAVLEGSDLSHLGGRLRSSEARNTLGLKSLEEADVMKRSRVPTSSIISPDAVGSSFRETPSIGKKPLSIFAGMLQSSPKPTSATRPPPSATPGNLHRHMTATPTAKKTTTTTTKLSNVASPHPPRASSTPTPSRAPSRAGPISPQPLEISASGLPERPRSLIPTPVSASFSSTSPPVKGWLREIATPPSSQPPGATATPSQAPTRTQMSMLFPGLKPLPSPTSSPTTAAKVTATTTTSPATATTSSMISATSTTSATPPSPKRQRRWITGSLSQGASQSSNFDDAAGMCKVEVIVAAGSSQSFALASSPSCSQSQSASQSCSSNGSSNGIGSSRHAPSQSESKSTMKEEATSRRAIGKTMPASTPVPAATIPSTPASRTTSPPSSQQLQRRRLPRASLVVIDDEDELP